MSTKVVSSVTANNGLVVGGTALTATADGNVLIRSGGSLVFRNLTAADISGGGGSYTDEQAQDAINAMWVDTTTISHGYVDDGPFFSVDLKSKCVTNAYLANMSAYSVKGNKLGSAGGPIDLLTSELTTLVDLFSSSLKGLVPASGGGVINFLRADGTWTPPATPTASYTMIGGAVLGTANVTLPTWATWLEIEGIGSGAGGGGGSKAGVGANRVPANGGNGGSKGVQVYKISDLGLAARVIHLYLGGWGTGGAGATANNSSGTAGTNAGELSVMKDGSGGTQIFRIYGAVGGTPATYGGGGNNGLNTANYPCSETGSLGGTADFTGTALSPNGGHTWAAGSGGGAGGGILASNVARANGVGGVVTGHEGSVITGQVHGGPGGDGGASGGANNGADGASYGGGGGGGSAGQNNAYDAGAGGHGGPGIIRARWW